MIGIYKITNQINQKSYIGQSKDIEQRFAQHKRNIGSFENSMYIEMQQYGLNNFKFEILEECKEEQLDAREQYWITHYNTFINGYNLTPNGKGRYSSSFVLFNNFKKVKYLEIESQKGLIIYLFPDNTFYLDLSLNFKDSIKKISSKVQWDKSLMAQHFRQYCENNKKADVWKTFFRKVNFLIYDIEEKEKRKEEYQNTLKRIQAFNLSKCCYNFKLENEDTEINLVDYCDLPEALCGIYQLTFSNGKSYIGSSNNLRKRILEHLKAIRNRKSDWHGDLYEELLGYEYDNLEKSLKNNIQLRIQYTVNEKQAREFEANILKQIYDNHFQQKYYNTQYLIRSDKL